jgi:hypothetical protein
MQFFRDIALTVAAFALTLFALEGALRLAGLRLEASLYTEEQQRGYASRPLAAGWSTAENDVFVRINSDGMRDRERAVVAPPDTLRIAVLGASEVDSRTVNLDDTFEAVMEGDLRQDLKSRWRGVEVLNFGVPGYNLAQEYLTLRDHVWKYHPQIVILATTSNVMIRNTRNLLPTPPPTGTPFYTLDHGSLVPDPETRLAPPLDMQRVKWKDRFSEWMNQSELLLLGNEALRIKAPEVLAQIKARFSPKATDRRRDLAQNIAALTYTPEMPQTHESWRIGAALLQAMQEECRSHGAEFWVVVIGTAIEVHPDPSVPAALAQRLGLPSLMGSDERLAALARAHGIHALLLAPEMGRYAASQHLALHGFAETAYNEGHWNQRGHRLAAKLITEELLRSSAVISARPWPPSACQRAAGAVAGSTRTSPIMPPSSCSRR